MRCLRFVSLILALAAAASAAGLSKYKDWADSPQAYFLSKAEREAWAAVQSDGEAEKLIAEYQAARGKGFTAAIQSRIDVADRTYKTGKLKGARSPQGRTLVLLGDPSRVDRRTGRDRTVADPTGAGALTYSDSSGKAGGSAANPLSNVGGPGPNTMRGMQAPEPSFIRWVYADAKLPPGASQKEVVIAFDDDASGNVTFQDAEAAEAVFQKVIEYWAPKKK